MEKVTLYTIGCPRCNILVSKLDSASVKYSVCDDRELMEDLSITELPVLDVNGETMGFKQAVDWINERVKNEH